MMVNFIPTGAILSISEKCQGTSGRTGYLKEIRGLNWFQRLWNKIFSEFGPIFKEEEYKYISGSRRVILDPSREEQGYYQGTGFRSQIHSRIKTKGLHQGETLYYEIVGYTDRGSLIMGSHKIQDKALKKKYGSRMEYTYGCENTNEVEGCQNPEYIDYKPLYKVLVYRITQTSPDSYRRELPLQQIISRCKELEMEIVPQLLLPSIYNGKKEELLELCEKLTHRSSALDNRHIKEGIVLRVDAPNTENYYKYKGFAFCELEGIAKNSDYVDPEEVA